MGSSSLDPVKAHDACWRRWLTGALLVCCLLAANSAPAAPRRKPAHATPAASASPAASPADDSAASSSPLPSPDASASPASGASSPSASGTPSPAFVQKYEAAMVQFLQKDYAGAKKLLDEADAIQPGQPNSVNLRNQIFKQYYEAAYAAYQHADYPTALTQLDGADATGSNVQNQSDAYNLRGLVLSKQRNYTEAENMFHKAAQTDPGLWAAKFNYAEVPFNYRNFTVARTRFETLFSETDPVKQPVEAELTQFKVFLTLLLEGKEDAARTFMQHFNFSGATPARYFCQAALNFYTGDVDKAQGWIDSARKEYPARKSSSFLEAFYRVGWLTDPNATGAAPPALVASASASPSAASMPSPPAFTPAPSATPAVAAATPKPTPTATVLAMAATPKPTPVATATPTATLLAMAAPKPTPTATSTPPAVVAATPKPTATPTATAVAVATPKLTPTATPTPTAVVAATPKPTATPTATAIAAVTPKPTLTATPTATVALASATPKASPVLPAVVLTTPKPVPSATVAPTLAASPSLTPEPTTAEETPEATASPAGEEEEPAATTADAVKIGAAVGVLLYFLYVVATIIYTALTRKSRKSQPRRAGAGMPSYQGDKDKKTESADTPR